MIDQDALKRIEELERIYERNWGKKVDNTITPIQMSQADFAIVMERIADTGESILVGYEKCFLHVTQG